MQDKFEETLVVTEGLCADRELVRTASGLGSLNDFLFFWCDKVKPLIRKNAACRPIRPSDQSLIAVAGFAMESMAGFRRNVQLP